MRKTVMGLCLVAAGTLALAGCQTTSIDNAVRKSLPQVCDAATIGHAAFAAYATTGHASARDVRLEAAGYASLFGDPADATDGICDDPASQNSVTVLVAATDAYAKITAALKSAKGE